MSANKWERNERNQILIKFIFVLFTKPNYATIFYWTMIDWFVFYGASNLSQSFFINPSLSTLPSLSILIYNDWIWPLVLEKNFMIFRKFFIISIWMYGQSYAAWKIVIKIEHSQSHLMKRVWTYIHMCMCVCVCVI